MRSAARRLVLALVGILASAFPNEGWCADPPAIPGKVDAPRPSSIAFAAGGAWTDLHLFGSVRDTHRGVAIASVELRRTLKVTEGVAFDYVADIVPVEVQTGVVVDDSPGVLGSVPIRANVYGAGLDPLGISVRRARGDWRPFATVRGGVRIFQQPVPDPRSSRFNFVADLGLGVLRRVGASSWVSVSLDLHHVSNAGLADSNRGINQVVLNVGFMGTR